MLTAGIDLSSQDKNTASCVIEWTDGSAQITELSLGVSDEKILALIDTVDKTGIDVPFGWPSAFVDAVTGHGRDGTWPSDYSHSNTLSVRYRRTDLAVWRANRGSQPLSVSTDRIALPAMRAAALIARLPNRIALDGSGVVVEVYPAAALKRWGFISQGYKRREGTEIRRKLVEDFVDATTKWLYISPDHVEFCLRSDDAFDSVIAALVARSSTSSSLIDEISEEDLAAANREGWIALPTEESLGLLAVD